VLWLRSRRKPDKLIVEPDQDVRENLGFYDEEGAGDWLSLNFSFSVMTL